VRRVLDVLFATMMFTLVCTSCGTREDEMERSNPGHSLQCKWQGPVETGYSVEFVHENTEVVQSGDEANEDCTPCSNGLIKMQERMGNFFSARSVRYKNNKDEEEEEEEEEFQTVRKCLCKLSWQQSSFFSFIHKKREVCTGQGCWLKYQSVLNFDQPEKLIIDAAHQSNIDVSCHSCLSGECKQIVTLKSFHIIKIESNSAVDQEVDVRAKSRLECLKIELGNLGVEFFGPKQLERDDNVKSALDQTLPRNVDEPNDEGDILKNLPSNSISPNVIGDLLNKVKRDTKTKKSDKDDTVEVIKDAVKEFEKKEVEDISIVIQEEKAHNFCEKKQFPRTCIVHPAINAGKEWQQKLHGQGCRGNLLLLPLQRPRPLQHLGVMAALDPGDISSSSSLKHWLTAPTNDLVSHMETSPTSLGEMLPGTMSRMSRMHHLSMRRTREALMKQNWERLAKQQKSYFNSYWTSQMQQYQEKRKYIAIRLQDTHSAQDQNRKMPSGLLIFASSKGVDPEYVLVHGSMNQVSYQLESLDESGNPTRQSFHDTSRLMVRLAEDRTKVHIEQWQPPSRIQRLKKFVWGLFTWTSTSESRPPLISETLSVLTEDDVVKCLDLSAQNDDKVDKADEEVQTSDNDDTSSGNDDTSEFEWDFREDTQSTDTVDTPQQEPMDSIDYSAVSESDEYDTPEPNEGFLGHINDG